MKWYKRKGRGRSAGRVRITPIFAFPPTGSHHNTTHTYSRPSSRRHNFLFWPRVEKSCRLGRPNRSYYLLLLLLLLLMLTPMLFRTSRDRERVIIKSIGRIIVCVYSVRALPYTTTSSTSCRPVRGGGEESWSSVLFDDSTDDKSIEIIEGSDFGLSDKNTIHLAPFPSHQLIFSNLI